MTMPAPWRKASELLARWGRSAEAPADMPPESPAVAPADPIRSVVFDGYVQAAPSPQNAVDTVPGWNHALPPEIGAVAGPGFFYEDPRIHWCIEQFGDLAGRTILELGPLEGSHTSMLDRHAPAVIHSIEANKLCYLRCLIVKELLALKHARFMLGNFVPWLEDPGHRYDLILASGVLYHMRDPVHFLTQMAARADAIFLWTHYFDDGAMPVGDPRRVPFSEEVLTSPFQGIEVRLHTRGYFGAWEDRAFCGGMHDVHYWLERDQILDILRGLGFTDVRLAHDEPDHQNGPCFSVFARR